MDSYLLIGIVFLIIAVFLIWSIIRSKQNESENQKLRASLESEREETAKLREFIAALSQELRIPLNGINGLTNILIDENPKIKNNPYFKSLKFSSEYLLKLINNVVHLNYLESEEMKIHQEYFNIKITTKNLVNSFNYVINSTDNQLHFNFDPDINVTVKGDAAVLNQVLTNLITNALRFTRNGNIYVNVKLVKKTEEQNRICFEIKHDGNPLSSEDTNSIFNEFVNIENSKKSYLNGGLHSTIVNKLASSMGGEILNQDLGSEGYVYSLVLDFDIKEQKRKLTNGNIKKSNTMDKPKILVVDDNKLNLLVADKMLSHENFDCTTVDNGYDAIDLVKDNTYNVILMDINMPDINGIGTTKKIREFNTETPIIALTGVDVTQLNNQIMESGFNDYILKPYEKSVLLELINKHIKTD